MLRGLFLGFIRIHILFHAAEAPVFGVALMAELGRHGYQIGPGTLYPILHKLARDGYLRQEGEVVNGKVRKYYRITSAGRRILAQAQAQLNELVGEALQGVRRRSGQRAAGGRGRPTDGRARRSVVSAAGTPRGLVAS